MKDTNFIIKQVVFLNFESIKIIYQRKKKIK